MDQYVPYVTDSDVERIIARDIPKEFQEEIRVLIRMIKVSEKARVVLACLKNSGSDVNNLKSSLSEASGYYREIVGEAEYPNYMKKAFHIHKLSEAEKCKIIENDKNQYFAWLNR
jgi:hypothetical protein